MVKLKAPLLSFLSRGRLGGITFLRRRNQNIAEKTPIPSDRRTDLQLEWRHMYQKCADLWHTLSAEEKRQWESLAGRRHMTGFAYWQSQCLKPNPGIYLPLQGGTMQGNIDMASHKILTLPLPTDSQEPLTLSYHIANIAPYLYNEGARVYHNVNYSVPHNTFTILPFNSELYDTDSIHDPAVSNSRLTCQTAGKYLIMFNCLWAFSAVGERQADIRLNDTSCIALHRDKPSTVTTFSQFTSTVYDLSVGDFVEVRVYQDSGDALNISYLPFSTPVFLMQRIGL